MSKFFKKGEIQLVNGGYLSNSSEEPVYNHDFVVAQRSAEYIITFAKIAKTKNFKEVKLDSIEDLKQEVLAELYNKRTEFVTKPKEVDQKLTKQLAEEALSFVKFQEESSKVDKMNNFLQKFNILKEFEEFGLFFENGITKLNNLYTLEEVVKAVTETIDLLED